MANVNSLTSASSTASSLYGSRNILSGLASGLDTEAMIENSISGYKTKITQLEQSQTKIQWKQDSYREIISLAANMTTKYSSYTSSTNLSSASFFDGAAVTSTLGTYANMVSAQGTTSSNIKINSVTRMATSASYGITLDKVRAMGTPTSVSSQPVDLDAVVPHNSYAGTYSIQVGMSFYSINVDVDDTYRDADELAALLNSKMDNQTIRRNEEDHALSEYFEVENDGSSITFVAKDPTNMNMTAVLFTEPGGTEGDAQLLNGNSMSVDTVTVGENLAGRKLSVTVDGVSQEIELDSLSDDRYSSYLSDMDKLTAMLNDKLAEKFADKNITVTSDSSGALSFDFEGNGHTLQISAAEGEPGYFQNFLRVNSAEQEEEEEQQETTLSTKLSELNISLDSGTVNGVEINFTETLTTDSTIKDVLTAINNSGAGVKATYSELTKQLYFVTNKTGSDQKIEFGGDLVKLFGAAGEGTEGHDAELSIEVNGQIIDGYTSKSNTIDMDGMKVTLKGTFTPTGTETGVQFGGSANSDKIVDAVKSFVEDYNNLVSKLRTAYTTQPAKQSNGSSYDPLTESDRNTMSESAIKNYEEQAKQGILFGDSDLSAMYSQLVSKLTSSGAESSKLAEIGITTSYNRESGLTTLVLDENKLRTSLESGTDKVKNVFVNSAYGANDGLVGRVKSTLDTYASTSSGSPGILVSKAGTKLSPVSLLNNTLQKQISNVQEQIERWQTKMSNRIDYYTKQFSRLEQLMNTMNSQSSMLAGMMGG